MIFETERLYLRKITQDDLADLAEILQNPNVMYAYEHDFSDNDVQVWLNRQIERYNKNGVGLWAVILKDLGVAGLFNILFFMVILVLRCSRGKMRKCLKSVIC